MIMDDQPAGHELRVGVAKRVITPPSGLPMAGYAARIGVALGRADALHVRAITFRDAEGGAFALVVSDLLAYTFETVQAVRRLIAEDLQVDPDAVLLATTHTHSGPAFGSMAGHYSEQLQEGAVRACRHWASSLPSAIVQTLRDAIATERSAYLSVCRTEAQLSVNRRNTDPFGEVRLVPNPAGFTDTEVVVLRASEANSGDTIATLIAYACHPVVLCEDNLAYSSDFVGYTLAAVDQALGGISIFVNGACGNINPRLRGDFETARELGEKLAKAALAEIPASEPVPAAKIQHLYREVAMPIGLPSSIQLQDYVDNVGQALESHKSPGNFEHRRLETENARAVTISQQAASRYERIEPRTREMTLLVPLQIVSFGPLALVGVPGELFAELGGRLKQLAPQKVVIVVGYTNEAMGYFPTEEAYSEGGYEVTSSNVASGGGERLISEAVACLRRLADKDQGVRTDSGGRG